MGNNKETIDLYEKWMRQEKQAMERLANSPNVPEYTKTKAAVLAKHLKEMAE